jgi:hypothetical protein
MQMHGLRQEESQASRRTAQTAIETFSLRGGDRQANASDIKRQPLPPLISTAAERFAGIAGGSSDDSLSC